MPIILVVLVALICVAVLLVVIWCIRHNYKAIDVRVQLPTVDKYSAGDQSEAESQSLIPCSDSGIEEKRNDTIIISRNNSIVKTRRPLPAPPIAPTSTRASTDSGVIPNSLASLTVDKKLTDGEVVELSPFCKHDVSDSTDKCQVMNTDETCRSQMEYKESSRDSSGELRSYPTNGAASPGDYCQWDFMAFSSNDSSKPHNLSGEGFPMPPGGYEISTNGENIPVSIVESKSTTGESVSVQSAEHTISATGERMLVFPEEHRHSASRKLNNVPTGEYSIGTNMESIPVPNGECGICTTEKAAWSQ
ncbi:uncharacterized protein [Argopecten irradians]|uniref:uncharacterized protein n=1 Tax=Argopecten irradians TaxID=31199 RepID=UPI00371CF7BF